MDEKLARGLAFCAQKSTQFQNLGRLPVYSFKFEDVNVLMTTFLFASWHEYSTLKCVASFFALLIFFPVMVVFSNDIKLVIIWKGS